MRQRQQYYAHAKHWFKGLGKNDWSFAPYLGAHARYVTEQYQVRVPGRIYEDLEATYTGQSFYSAGLTGGVGLWGFFNDHWFMTAQANLLYLPLVKRPNPLETLPGVGLYLAGFAPSLNVTVGYRF